MTPTRWSGWRARRASACPSGSSAGCAPLHSAPQRFVSAASAFEIALKTRTGRLHGGQSLLDGWERLLRNLLATELPLSCAHARHAGSLDWVHRDPFDRMLVAQAPLDGLTLLTADRAITSYSAVATTW